MEPLPLITGIYTVSPCLHADLVQRRTDVVDKLQDFESTIDPILSVLALPEVTKHFEESGK